MYYSRKAKTGEKETGVQAKNHVLRSAYTPDDQLAEVDNYKPGILATGFGQLHAG